MKKYLIIIGALLLTGCNRQSKRQQAIEEYELAEAKIAYIQKLILIRNELQLKDRVKYLDSCINSELKDLENDGN